MINNVYKDDYGVTIKFTILDQASEVFDASTAENIIFNFEKPDTTQVYRSGVFQTNGADGGIIYTTESGLLDQAGYWKVNAYVSSEEYKHTTGILRFKVAEDL